MDNQKAKADAGKPKLTLVPRQIIYDIAEVREYGNKKYGNPENWVTVEVGRYRDAAFRHFMAYLDNPQGVDEESGIKHLKHLACNIAFLCELDKTVGHGSVCFEKFGKGEPPTKKDFLNSLGFDKCFHKFENVCKNYPNCEGCLDYTGG